MGVFVALELDKIFDELFPICRSITGEGLRQSLAICSQYIPLTIESTPSGEEVFDWVVPPEWNITSARLTGPDGEVVADFSEHNLRVVNYSAPVTAELPLDWSRLCALKIDSFHVQPRLDVVSANYQDAARQAVLRLRAQGRRRIGLVIARGDETRLENHAYAGFLVEHATTDWERTIPPFAIDDASAGPVRDWAEWLSRHRIDALVVAAPGWDGWLEQAGIQAPGIPVVRFRVRAERGQPGLVLNHREVGVRAVELLAMRWHTNQRGLPAFVSNTFTPVDWSDGSELGAPAVAEAGTRANARAGGR